MPTVKLSGLVHRFRRDEPEAPDAELLRRFTTARDEAAFATLVRRHGPMVFAVCRRVTGSHHLSEDAFQAVFVVLATKAGSVRAGSLPAFLHGVATRTALRARTVADRRRRRETPVAELPDAPTADRAPAEALDLAALVDEEVAQLSEVLRTAVVLCELEGCSRKEAAERLGVSEGTISSRLAAARKALAARLRNRGVVPSAAGLSAALGTAARASASANLIARTIDAALTPALRPETVSALATGVLRIMFARKLKTALPLTALALGALATVALAADRPPAAPPTPKPVAAHRPAPVPKPRPKGPSQLLYFDKGKLVLAAPDGKTKKTIEFEGAELHQSGGRLSPDGKTIAYLASPEIKGGLGEFVATTERPKLHVRPLDDRGPGTSLGITCESFVWSPDGTEIACSTMVDKPGQQPAATTVIVNVKSKEKTDPKLPASHAVTDWAPDGRLLTTSFSGTDAASAKARLYLMNRDGTEHKALAPDTNAMIGHISPDGTRVLCSLLTFKAETPAEKKAREAAGDQFPDTQSELAVLDIATGKITKVRDVPSKVDMFGYCWSPDSKQIAYTYRQKHEEKPNDIASKETESRLIVCDPDGKNAKTVVSAKGTGQWHITLSGLHWR